MSRSRTLGAVLTAVLGTALLVGAGASAEAASTPDDAAGLTIDGIQLPQGAVLRDAVAVEVTYTYRGETRTTTLTIDPGSSLAGSSFLAWSSLPGVPIDSCITQIEVQGPVRVPTERLPVCGIDLVDQPLPTVAPEPPATVTPVPLPTEQPATVVVPPKTASPDPRPTAVPTTSTKVTAVPTTPAKPTAVPTTPAKPTAVPTTTPTPAVARTSTPVPTTATTPAPTKAVTPGDRAEPPTAQQATPDPVAAQQTRVLAHTGANLGAMALVAAVLLALGGLLAGPVRMAAVRHDR
ncbi:hypothetical protein [Cellulomonas sp. PhB150]|uniref:hypothetical protein n=1 Tax=Cellulomonas sp. PhB150 TaxID=2485188 RepID=UPI000F46BB62|nr:hypothetical protein [Cellulomonas sp. PhB150]ROS31093.1 hypothetical protein EDF34_0745 [Cellulomonas sp. PhB150]